MMKKITLLLAVLVYGFALNAQTIYFEDFESEMDGTAPTSMTALNEDACSINNPTQFVNETWTVQASGGAQGNIAAAQSWTVPACQVDDWLITPVIDLTTAAAGTALSWLASSFEAAFPEDYQVLLSTTGSSPADFTNVLLTVNAELDAWTPHTVDLTPYFGGSVYIAFRLISNDKSRCFIDDIKVATPPPYSLVSGGNFSIVNGVNQNHTGFIESIVVDYSKRNNVEFTFDVNNEGTDVAESIVLSIELSNGDGNISTTITDTVNAMLASGSTYTHTFAPQDLTVLFPTLATNEPISIQYSIDSNSYNPEVNGSDSLFTFLISPTESYTVPYSNSFELRSGDNPTFEHSTYGWKYLDNDMDDNTFGAYSFSNVTPQDGDWIVMGSIIDGNQLSINAVDETLQSPEFSLTAGTAYQFSIYASSFFGQSGSFDMELTDATGSFTSGLGAINLLAADSFLEKYKFQMIATDTQEDYLVNINKNATGLLIMDQFEIIEITSAPAAPLVTTGWDACDSTVTISYNMLDVNTYTVDWGDGTAVETLTSSSATHSYLVVGTTYSITVKATNILGNADGSVMLDAEEIAAPSADFILNPSNPSVSLTALENLPCNTYVWIYGDGTPNDTTTSTTNHNYAINGTHPITLIVINSAGTATTTQEVTISGVGINDLTFVDGINVFPNPATDVLNIAFELNSNQDVTLSLVSIDGKVVNTISSNNTSKVNETINTSNLSTGLYVLNITSNEGVYTRNIVVK